MRTLEKYQTRDGKIHDSAVHAENHILANAAKELKEVIQMACPSLPEAYAIAQKVILLALKNKEAMRKLKLVTSWLNDLTEGQ